MEENANELHFRCLDFNSSTRPPVYAEYIDVFYQNLVLVAVYYEICQPKIQHETATIQLSSCSKCCPLSRTRVLSLGHR